MNNCKECSIERIEREIKKCNFKCKEGPLKTHRGYIALLEKAKQLQTENDEYKSASLKLMAEISSLNKLVKHFFGAAKDALKYLEKDN